MSVLMEFSIFPTDKGGSVSKYVSRVIKNIRESGVSYKLTAMGTIVETDSINEALDIVRQSYEVLAPDSERVYATVKFDIRKNADNRLEGKLQSVESKIGKVRK